MKLSRDEQISFCRMAQAWWEGWRAGKVLISRADVRRCYLALRRDLAATTLMLMLLAAPAFAWRVAPEIAAGIVEGEPATRIGLVLDHKGSKLHVRPHVSFWRDGSAPGEWTIATDLLWQARSCMHGPTPYVGLGVGAVWLPEVPSSAPPTPTVPEPPPVDPPQPLVALTLGFKWPGTRLDPFVEGRSTWADENRVGVYAGIVAHEARQVVGAKKAHRGHRR